MHPEAMAYVGRVASGISGHEFLRIVDLGGRNVNGSPRDLFPGASYVAVDVEAGPGVDVVADAATYQPETAPDLVLCCEVLEHARQASRIVENALQMLAPGGRLVVTAAAPWRGPHSAKTGGRLRPGEFYRNVDPAHLYDWVIWSDVAFTTITLEVDRKAGDVRMTVVKA